MLAEWARLVTDSFQSGLTVLVVVDPKYTPAAFFHFLKTAARGTACMCKTFPLTFAVDVCNVHISRLPSFNKMTRIYETPTSITPSITPRYPSKRRKTNGKKDCLTGGYFAVEVELCIAFSPPRLSTLTKRYTYKYYFLRPFIYGAFVFRKFLCPSSPTNVGWFLHPKKHNFISFPTVSKVLLPSGSIQQQFWIFWCHPIMDVSRIDEKCANFVFFHSNSLQKIPSNCSFTLFNGANFTIAS